jgi:hypothetical protein
VRCGKWRSGLRRHPAAAHFGQLVERGARADREPFRSDGLIFYDMVRTAVATVPGKCLWLQDYS